jgi:Large polyvalent protein associated domain 29
MNYTTNAWKGANYNSSLSTKDITAIIRDYVKTNYKDCKFSVTKRDNSINVSLMSAPFDVFATPDVSMMRGDDFRYGADYFMSNWTNAIARGHHGVNHYYINDSKLLTDKAKAMFTDITKFMNGYNYDDSDIMTDYFNTNFYMNLAIGKWDKPFIKTN